MEQARKTDEEEKKNTKIEENRNNNNNNSELQKLLEENQISLEAYNENEKNKGGQTGTECQQE